MNEAPRFKIGQQAWNVGTHRTVEALPCPDCNGTKTWRATSAAGEAFDVQCLRCTASYSGLDGRHVPALSRPLVTHSVRELTIGSLRMDTAEEPGRVFSYMCEETGIGSGRIYYEADLYDDEADAQAAGKRLAELASAELRQEPRALRAEDYAGRTLRTALPYAWDGEMYHAWDRARYLREFVESEEVQAELTTDSKRTLADVLEDRSWRSPHPVEAVLAEVRALKTKAWRGFGEADLQALFAAVDALDAKREQAIPR